MEYEKRLTDINLLGAFIEESLKENKRVKLTVTGDSMYPLFKSRIDTVLLTSSGRIKKRDIVFYKRENGRYILHRVLKINGDKLTIAGDNETKKEYPVYKENVFGKVEGFTHRGKEHTTNEIWYKLYSFIWCLFFPIRPMILRFMLKLLRLQSRIRIGAKK